MTKSYSLKANLSGKIHIVGEDGRSICGMLHDHSASPESVLETELDKFGSVTCALCRKKFGLEAKGERYVMRDCRKFLNQFLERTGGIQRHPLKEFAEEILEEMEKITWLK